MLTSFKKTPRITSIGELKGQKFITLYLHNNSQKKSFQMCISFPPPNYLWQNSQQQAEPLLKNNYLLFLKKVFLQYRARSAVTFVKVHPHSQICKSSNNFLWNKRTLRREEGVFIPIVLTATSTRAVSRDMEHHR